MLYLFLLKRLANLRWEINGMSGFNRNYRWWALVLVSSGVFLSVIDIFIVNVVIPAIKKGIHGSDGDSQLFIALYLIGYASFLITKL